MSSAALGTIAPDFTTRNQHGQSVTLSSLRGGPVVLNFFPWAFTGICTGELRAVQDHLGEFEGRGARVFAISTDTIFSLRVFAEQEALGFQLLSDHWPHGGIAASYGVFDERAGCALRGTFVLDAAGLISWRVVNQIGEARDVSEHLVALKQLAEQSWSR